MGFEASADVRVGDLEAGVMAWGGANQKGWTFTSITGAGCAWIEDWDRAQEAADGCKAYEPRRVDVALDLHDGSSSFDATLAAYRAGGFSPAGCGRPPRCHPMKPEAGHESAIIKIGNRASNKYLRGYEKGKQLLGPAFAAALASEDGDLGEVAMQMHPRFALDGTHTMVSMWDWWRLELELKPQTAPLPEDVIDRRDQYFAGAYPYLGEVLQGVDPEALVMRRERGPQLDLALSLATIQKQWGSTLFTALVAHHGDMGAVWEQICGHKHNDRLVKAGVLMVDHDDRQ